MATAQVTYCDVCLEDKAIIGQCHTCDGRLCKHCYTAHQSGRIFQDHSVSLFTDGDGQHAMLPLDITDEKCSIHTRESIIFYCEQHDVTGCGVCMTKDHKHCPEPVDLAEAARQHSQSGHLDTFRSDIDTFSNDIDFAVTDVQANLDACKDSRSRCLDDVKKVRERIDDHLDVMQNQIEQDITDRHDTIETMLQSIYDTFLDAKTKLDTQREELEHLWNAEQFGRLELGRTRSITGLTKLKTDVQEAKRKNCIDTYDFNPNPTLIAEVLTNVNSFGSLTEQIFGSDDASVNGASSGTLATQQVTIGVFVCVIIGI